MIDEEKFDKYLWELKSEPLFGRPIAEKLLRRDSRLRKEIILMLNEAQKGRFNSKPSDDSRIIQLAKIIHIEDCPKCHSPIDMTRKICRNCGYVLK